MLRSLESLLGYCLACEPAWRLDDFVIDSRICCVRYLALSDGTTSRLLPPCRLGPPDDAIRMLSLARGVPFGSLEACPPGELPTLAQERALSKRLGLPRPSAALLSDSASAGEPAPDGRDPHLLLLRDLLGYRIEALDDRAGHLAGLWAELEPGAWCVRYLAVDLPLRQGRQRLVLVHVDAVTRIERQARAVCLDLTRDAILAAPEFVAARPLERTYEARLHRHYGRPAYWNWSTSAADRSPKRVRSG